MDLQQLQQNYNQTILKYITFDSLYLERRVYDYYNSENRFHIFIVAQPEEAQNIVAKMHEINAKLSEINQYKEQAKHHFNDELVYNLMIRIMEFIFLIRQLNEKTTTIMGNNEYYRYLTLDKRGGFGESRIHDPFWFKQLQNEIDMGKHRKNLTHLSGIEPFIEDFLHYMRDIIQYMGNITRNQNVIDLMEHRNYNNLRYKGFSGPPIPPPIEIPQPPPPPQGAAEERRNTSYSQTSNGTKFSTQPSPQRNRRAQTNNRRNRRPTANNRNTRRNNTRRNNTRRRRNNNRRSSTRRSASAEDFDRCVQVENIANIIINTYQRHKDDPSLTNFDYMTRSEKRPVLHSVLNEIKPHLNPNKNPDRGIIESIDRGISKIRISAHRLRSLITSDKWGTLGIDVCSRDMLDRLEEADRYIGTLSEN